MGNRVPSKIWVPLVHYRSDEFLSIPLLVTNYNSNEILIVTTSKALVTSSEALVTSRFGYHLYRSDEFLSMLGLDSSTVAPISSS